MVRQVIATNKGMPSPRPTPKPSLRFELLAAGDVVFEEVALDVVDVVEVEDMVVFDVATRAKPTLRA